MYAASGNRCSLSSVSRARHPGSTRTSSSSTSSFRTPGRRKTVDGSSAGAAPEHGEHVRRDARPEPLAGEQQRAQADAPDAGALRQRDEARDLVGVERAHQQMNVVEPHERVLVVVMRRPVNAGQPERVHASDAARVQAEQRQRHGAPQRARRIQSRRRSAAGSRSSSARRRDGGCRARRCAGCETDTTTSRPDTSGSHT